MTTDQAGGKTRVCATLFGQIISSQKSPSQQICRRAFQQVSNMNKPSTCLYFGWPLRWVVIRAGLHWLLDFVFFWGSRGNRGNLLSWRGLWPFPLKFQ
ncbi:hypothetical protein CNN82_28620 [Pseudomonas frederiksbergensis]|uniref:Uncharacterized protein n=1 Tax=Pseudomonas frederiksbergensis TaxID=104087 RepID=A0AB33ELE1_9PSED|nr:hypothetical protein CNN82_28620 [Pseudomonas frederiksbergensis]